MSEKKTRRDFLGASGRSAIALTLAGTTVAGTALAGGRNPAAAADESQGTQGDSAAKLPLKIGLTTYMFKHYDLGQTIEMAKRVAVKPIILRSNLLPLDSTPAQIRDAIQRTEAAGLQVYGGGVIYMRRETEVHRAFEYSKAAGFRLITASILPDLLPLVDRKVKEYGIQVAIHNHGPEDKHYPTPVAIYEKVKKLDKRIGICHDTGHTQRAGVDPSDQTIKTADRTFDIHLKDVDAAKGEGHSTELGRGVVDLPRVLRTLVMIGFKGIVGIEYEKHMMDLLPGLAESVGYARGALQTMKKPQGS